jgi:hypothetical protein
MEPAAVAQAMICAFTAIFETLPPQSRHDAMHVLNGALAYNLVDDPDARMVVRCLVSAAEADEVVRQVRSGVAPPAARQRRASPARPASKASVSSPKPRRRAR